MRQSIVRHTLSPSGCFEFYTLRITRLSAIGVTGGIASALPTNRGMSMPPCSASRTARRLRSNCECQSLHLRYRRSLPFESKPSIEKRTYFHGAAHRSRTPKGPVESLVEIVHINDVVPTDLFLCLTV